MTNLLASNEIAHQLMAQAAIPLSEISGTGGIYALEDEHGIIRYVGETAGPLYDRIHNRHVAGDDNSHKYSSVFNAGRLWHPSSRDLSPIKRQLSNPVDGKTAKGLRNAFARSRCRARIVHLPGLTKASLKSLESKVLDIIPLENKRWNDSRQLKAYEPAGLDDFIETLRLSTSVLDALERQNERWNSLSLKERMIVRR